VELDGDGKSVTLAMRDVAVIDQPRWPALDASATPAKMSFKMGLEIDRGARSLRRRSKTVSI